MEKPEIIIAKNADDAAMMEGVMRQAKVAVGKESESALYAALAKAQADCAGTEKKSRNDHHRYKYASAEDMIDASTQAMDPHGLALVCTEAEPDDKKAPKWMTVRYLLTHNAGGSMTLGPYSLTIHPDKGRPMDKAITTCLTYLQAYCIRGILNVPRVEEGTERDHADDKMIQAHASEGEKIRKKVETAYGALWPLSQAFFDMAQVPRPRSKDGAKVFKQWIAWAANPEKPYPEDDDRGGQLVAIELAKKALKAWGKSGVEDQTYEAFEFAESIGCVPKKSSTEQAADDDFEADLEKNKWGHVK